MIRVFCDFDGTVAPRDVGNALFRTFGGREATDAVDRYLKGIINARQCFLEECRAVRSLSHKEFISYISQFELDPFFSDFAGFCERNHIPLVIVSDGMDAYVDYLLDTNGFSHIPRFANRLEFVPEGSETKLRPSFPFRDSECEQCANCKRNHLLTLSGDEDIIVYVGDGFSDRCPVRFADVVFAKGSLISYCQQQNISYQEFKDLGDVLRRLSSLVGEKKLKKRREAEVARREVFQQG